MEVTIATAPSPLFAPSTPTGAQAQTNSKPTNRGANAKPRKGQSAMRPKTGETRASPCPKPPNRGRMERGEARGTPFSFYSVIFSRNFSFPQQ